MEEKITATCPRCHGMRGHFRDGQFMPCIKCRTKGKIVVTSMAEKRRIERHGKRSDV